MVLILLHPWSSSSASPSDYGLACERSAFRRTKKQLIYDIFFPCVLRTGFLMLLFHSFNYWLTDGCPYLYVPGSQTTMYVLIKKREAKALCQLPTYFPNSSWLYDPACPTYCYSWAYLSYLPYLIVWLVTRNAYILSHLRKLHYWNYWLPSFLFD